MPFNNEYINNLNKAIDQCTNCTQINKLKDDVERYFDKRLAEILKGIDILAPLCPAPGDIGAVVTWIGNFINSNILGPYNKLITLQAEVTAAYASITSRIASKISTLSCDLVPNKGIGMGGSLFGDSMFGNPN